MPRLRPFLHTGLALGAVSLATIVMRALGTHSSTTVALTYLLVVLFVASATSLWLAVLASIVSMLALNYFFMPPVGTFTIADPHNWVALMAFRDAGRGARPDPPQGPGPAFGQHRARRAARSDRRTRAGDASRRRADRVRSA